MVALNLHDFAERSRANGPGERAVVWVQGCPRRCVGCFNPDTLAFDNRNETSVDELESRIAATEGIDGVTFSGGEPFAYAEALADLARRIHRRGLTVVCYTGYTLGQLSRKNRADWNALLEEVDLLIDGPFVQQLRTHDPYRGSKNQKLHFLSGRITPGGVEAKSQMAEFTLGPDGKIFQTGFPEFPDADRVFREIKAILG